MANTVVKKEVLQGLIEEKMGKNVRFLPLAVRYDLGEGTAIRVVKQKYIGDATVVEKGQPIPIKDFQQTSETKEVRKVGNGIELAVEDLMDMGARGAEYIERQLLASIDNGLQNAIVAELTAITGVMVHDATVEGKINADVVADALAKFGEDQEDAFLLVHSKTLTQMRKEADFQRISGDEFGAVGEIFGARVMVSDAVVEGEAYLVKQGALELHIRRQPLVEAEPKIGTQTELYVGTAYFVANLLHDSKAVKIDLV